MRNEAQAIPLARSGEHEPDDNDVADPNQATVPNGALEQPQVTHAMEDYLKAIYRLQETAAQVTTQRLAEELGVTGPSVTNMIKRLHDLRLLRHSRYHGVELTDAGIKIALEVLRHHRLLELYLAETLGMPWDQVHAEAERLEHHLSDQVEERMDSALGHPTHDPHGDPIPSREGTIDSVSGVLLIDLEPGRQGIVTRVSDRDPEQLRYLGGLGLYPGATVSVLERLPFDGPIRIAVNDAEHVIGRPLATAVHIGNPTET
jgi:DtxR family transcriptional regulator, Mn-dependent transcriptional regulator